MAAKCKDGRTSNPENDDWTDKERLFVAEYLVDCNATQAAKRAGYQGNNLPYISCILMKKPHIKAAIEARRKEIQRKTEITQERVISEIAKMAFLNSDDLLEKDSDGNLVMRDWDYLSRSQKACISRVKTTINSVTRTKTTIYEFYNKQTALEMLSKHLGIYEKDNHQKRPIDINIGTLNQIFAHLPPEQRDSFRFSLVKAITAAGNGQAIEDSESIDAEFVQNKPLALPEGSGELN